MATIEELEISGIRSFSPDFPQAIKFEHPLTLLVGPNGAGKSVREFYQPGKSKLHNSHLLLAVKKRAR